MGAAAAAAAVRATWAGSGGVVEGGGWLAGTAARAAGWQIRWRAGSAMGGRVAQWLARRTCGWLRLG